LRDELRGKEQQRTSKTNERGDKIAERTAKENERKPLQDRLDVVVARITELNGAIKALEDERALAVAEVEARQALIPGLIANLTAIVIGGLIFTQPVQALIKGDMTRDSFSTRDFTDEFEQVLSRILANVARAIEDTVDQEFLMENAQVGLGDWRFEQGQGIAGRFGALPPAQTLALGMASALGAILGTLRQLLDNADSLPQSPIAMAEAGIARLRMAL
jgi:hypothetical protein